MNQEVISLFKNYLDDQCSQKEVARVLRIIAEDEYQEELEFVLAQDALQSVQINHVITVNEQEKAIQLHARIARSIQKSEQTITTRLWAIITAAAVVLVVAGTIWFWTGKDQAIWKGAAQANEVRPAKSGATLTLASGERINVASMQKESLLAEKGIYVEKSASGQLIYLVNEKHIQPEIHTLSTTKGETYQLILADGTKVWLNAASSLSYNAVLTYRGQRKVKLTGEAYFEVAKDAKHPFLIETDRQVVQVLGTHLNINSYPFSAYTNTTLLEGAVKVSSGGAEKTLVPGQQAVSKGEEFTVQPADLQKVMGWKNNLFVFRDDELADILENIAIWYRIKVEYNQDIKGIKYWGAISNKNKLSDILNYLSRAGKVHFEFEKQTLKVFRD